MTNSQANRILLWLKSGKRITAIEALENFGCFRLAARISDLREDGHNIVTDRVETHSGSHIAEYRLEAQNG